MHLYGFRVFVHGLDAARHFYRDVLELKVDWEHNATAIGFDLGAILIVETIDAAAGPEDGSLVGRFVGCSIAVEDIEAHLHGAPGERRQVQGAA